MNQKATPLLITLLFAVSFAAAQQTLQEDQDFRFAVQLENRELYDIAALQFERFAEIYPMSPQAPTALLRAGENYEKADSLSRASQAYLTVLLRYPQAAILDKAQYNQGRVLSSNGEHLQAAMAFDRIKILAPKSALIPEAQIAAAQSYLQAGETQRSYDAAFYILENYSTHPSRLQAYKTIADVHEQRGDYTLAAQFVDRLLSDRIEDELAADAYIQKANLLKKLGRLTRADSVLNKLLAGNYGGPIVSSAALTLAKSMQEQGQLREAERVLTDALAKVEEGDKNDLWLTLGDNYYLEKNYSQAKSTFLRADMAGSGGLVSYRLGMANKALGDVPSALASFKQVLADTTLSEKIHLHAAIEYAGLAAEEGRAAEGIRYLQRIVANTTDQADRNELFFTIAALQEKHLRDFVGARQNYGAVMAGSAKSTVLDDAQYAIARSYEIEGDLKAALNEYSRYLYYYPGGDFYATSQSRVDLLRPLAPAHSKDLQPLDELVAARPTTSRAVGYHALAQHQMYALYDFGKALELLERATRENADEQLNLERVNYDRAFCHLILHEKATWENPGDAAEHAEQLTRLAESMATSHPSTKWTAQVVYWTALANLPARESPAERLDHLALYIDKTTDDSLKQHLQLRLVDEMVASQSGDGAALSQQIDSALDEILAKSASETIEAEALHKRALLLHRAGQPDSAAVLLNRLLQLRSSCRRVEGLYLLAAIEEERANDAEAQRLYFEVAENYFYSPLAERAEVKLISVMLRQGQVREAESRAQAREKTGIPRELKIFYSSKVDDEALWLWAELMRRTRSPQQAVEVLQDYLELGKDTKHYAEALFAVGELADEMNKQEMAIGFFQECAKAADDDVLGRKARLATAQLYFDRGRYDEASDLYADMQKDLAGDSRKQAMAQQVICLYRTGKLGRAEELIKQFKKEYSDRNAEARFLYEEGMYYIASKDFPKAEKTLKNLAKYDDVPEGARGDLGLARLYVVQTKTEDALDRLTQIPQKYKDPEIVATAYLNLADFYYENRALANSVDAGKRVLELTKDGPMRAQALDILINAHDDLGLRDQAIAYQRDYIATFPNAPDMLDRRIRIGTFYYYLKEYDRAIIQLKELKTLTPANDEARVQFWIAESYAAAGLTEQSIIEYLKVRYQCQQHPKLPFGVTALYKAGEGYQKLGNLPKAKEMYEMVVRERGATDDIGRHASRKLQEIAAEMEKRS